MMSDDAIPPAPPKIPKSKSLRRVWMGTTYSSAWYAFPGAQSSPVTGEFRSAAEMPSGRSSAFSLDAGEWVGPRAVFGGRFENVGGGVYAQLL
jgi:hypothetical protein